MTQGRLLPIVLASSIIVTGCVTAPPPADQLPQLHTTNPQQTFSGLFRTSMGNVTIAAAEEYPKVTISGDYQQVVRSGADAVTGSLAEGGDALLDQIITDPEAIILLPLMPILLPVYLLVGGATGAAHDGIRNKVQRSRDAHADWIANAAGNIPINERLAVELRKQLQTLYPDTADTAAEAELTLYVGVDSILITTNRSSATIMSTVVARLVRNHDGVVLFSKRKTHTYNASLKTWSSDRYAIWQGYVGTMGYAATPTITDRIFGNLFTDQILRPTGSDMPGTSPWYRELDTLSPELTWEFAPAPGDAEGNNSISARQLTFHVEVIEGQSVILSQENVVGNSYQVPVTLPPCALLEWRVRPIYRQRQAVQAGEWMYLYPVATLNDSQQRAHINQAAYGGFAKLVTPCRQAEIPAEPPTFPMELIERVGTH